MTAMQILGYFHKGGGGPCAACGQSDGGYCKVCDQRFDPDEEQAAPKHLADGSQVGMF
jgi:hypothetical protein